MAVPLYDLKAYAWPILWLRYGSDHDVAIFTGRDWGLRAFGDGLVSLLLPVYLAQLGLGAFEIGAESIGTAARNLSDGVDDEAFVGNDLVRHGRVSLVSRRDVDRRRRRGR